MARCVEVAGRRAARESVFALKGASKDPDAESDQAMRRAFGGCLGDKRRRRTWHAAISCGEG
jgi:hypothetical protein